MFNKNFMKIFYVETEPVLPWVSRHSLYLIFAVSRFTVLVEGSIFVAGFKEADFA